jgi:hypothetical protein
LVAGEGRFGEETNGNLSWGRSRFFKGHRVQVQFTIFLKTCHYYVLCVENQCRTLVYSVRNFNIP